MDPKAYPRGYRRLPKVPVPLRRVHRVLGEAKTVKDTAHPPMLKDPEDKKPKEKEK
jgi:hypothetical protein